MMTFSELESYKGGVNELIASTKTKDGETKVTDIDKALALAAFVEGANKIYALIAEIGRGIRGKYRARYNEAIAKDDKDEVLKINDELSEEVDAEMQKNAPEIVAPKFTKAELKEMKVPTMALVACKAFGMIEG